MIDLSTYTLPAGHSLVLRTSKADGTSRDGFKWPPAGGIATASSSDGTPV